MTEPELLFDQTEEYQSLAKTHKVLTFVLQLLGSIAFGFVIVLIFMIGGLR